MTPYEHWLQSHKLNLRAHTEAEIFQFGYDMGCADKQGEIDHLKKMIDALNDIIEEPVPQPAKKAKKNEST